MELIPVESNSHNRPVKPDFGNRFQVYERVLMHGNDDRHDGSSQPIQNGSQTCRFANCEVRLPVLFHCAPIHNAQYIFTYSNKKLATMQWTNHAANAKGPAIKNKLTSNRI